MDRRKVLVIEDERSNYELIEEALAGRYRLIWARDGEEGVKLARSETPDLILLDISMPRLDGFAACELLRENEATRHIPVMMLTGSAETEHRTLAFTRGADDFISRPFSVRELVARVGAKIRRIEEREGKDQELRVGNLVMNLDRLDVSVKGLPVKMSVLEFNLLRYFLQNRDRVLSRDRILEAVWRDSVVSARTIDTHIVGLRKKLAEADYTVTTVYGAGYALKPVGLSSKPAC